MLYCIWSKSKTRPETMSMNYGSILLHKCHIMVILLGIMLLCLTQTNAVFAQAFPIHSSILQKTQPVFFPYLRCHLRCHPRHLWINFAHPDHVTFSCHVNGQLMHTESWRHQVHYSGTPTWYAVIKSSNTLLQLDIQ